MTTQMSTTATFVGDSEVVANHYSSRENRWAVACEFGEGAKNVRTSSGKKPRKSPNSIRCHSAAHVMAGCVGDVPRWKGYDRSAGGGRDIAASFGRNLR